MASVKVSGNKTCISDVNVYLCSDKGFILPIFNETTWSTNFRSILYLIGLVWTFIGVSIIADRFMCAIEMIRSKTQTVLIADPESATQYRVVEVRMWNDTVANLTLMALGSSAPEILLAIVEVFGNKFKTGKLGPSTIVGSAAFNLLCITGVCISSIPGEEKRRIKSINVFIVTAAFSLFAYAWLAIILVAITPDYVDLWEAVVTLLFFPILVIIAFLADKNYCGGVKSQEEIEILSNENSQSEDKQLLHDVVSHLTWKLKDQEEMTDEEISKLAASEVFERIPHSRAWYKINAIRIYTGGPRLIVYKNEKQKQISETDQNKVTSVPRIVKDSKTTADEAIIEFEDRTLAILENEGFVRVTVNRSGKMSNRVVFSIETVDGTAESGTDYIPVNRTMVFEPGEASLFIDIEIIDDNEWEPDEVFFVKLSVDPDQDAILGNQSICQVTILNDDDPGMLEFANPSQIVKESIGKIFIPVERKGGADGKAFVKWKTNDITAIRNIDYAGDEGTLSFKHGQITKPIELIIHNTRNVNKGKEFEVILTDTSEGAELGKLKRSVITIVTDENYQKWLKKIVNMTSNNLEWMNIKTTTWAVQFQEAMNVNGGNVESASCFDYVMHLLSFGWKILFAFVPPPSICDGWLTFTVSLMVIAILTVFVEDLARIFGCLIDLDDSVTAITFVAIGTSMPDLFASKQAATYEKTADNSIGNVTGSNSVNVFLGLGLPWAIASFYWTLQGKTFEVPAGSLSFSIILYTLCAMVGVSLLLIRRVLPIFGKAELGGPRGLKIFSSFLFISLWVVYIIISSLQVYGHISVTF